MRRFMFIVVAAIGLALVASTHRTVRAATTPMRIKIATVAPKDSSYYRILLEMGERWRTLSDGQIELRVYAGGLMGDEADSVKKMNIGELQGALLSAGGLTEIDQSVGVLEEIPMLFRSLVEEEYVREKLRPDLDKRLLARGFVSLAWADSGWVRLFSRRAAVRPGDYKNMKIFVAASGSAQEMAIMQALGYTPKPLTMADALIQLQTGGVDAVPTLPVMALAGQYYTAIKHMNDVNWTALVGAAVLTKRAWDAVPQALHEPFLQAAEEAGRKIQAAGRLENEQAIATMKAKWQLEVHPLTAEVDAEWRTFAESVYPKIRGTLVPADMFDAAKRLVDEYRASHRADGTAR